MRIFSWDFEREIGVELVNEVDKGMNYSFEFCRDTMYTILIIE